MSTPQDSFVTPIDWEKHFAEEYSYGDPILPLGARPPNTNTLSDTVAVLATGLFALGVGVLAGIGLAHKLEEHSDVNYR